MRGVRVEVLHRIKGKSTLIRSVRGLLLRVHRYGRGRARTPGDVRWAARALDALDRALSVMDESDASAPQGEARLTGQVSVAAPPSIVHPAGAGAVCDGSDDVSVSYVTIDRAADRP
jgi:hypothetical protein